MTRTIDILRKNESKTSAGWRKEAEFRRNNAAWLHLSQMIALLSRSRMNALNVTQHELAKRINCSQQNVSNILSGKANLTLDTIAKLEDALQFSMISEALRQAIG